MARFLSIVFSSFTENIPAQIIGFAALLINVLSYQFNSRRTTIFIQFFSTVLFSVHFFMLGATSGAIINIFAAISTAIFYFRGEKKLASSPLWPILIVASAAAVNIINWEGLISLCPIISFAISRAALWNRNPRILRLLIIPSSVLFLIYNFISASYAGFLCEAFTITSVLIAIIRFDILKKHENVK